VRLLITKRLRGSIDGLRLWPFEPGCAYEVGTTLANYLLAIEAAEPVVETLLATPHEVDRAHAQRH
jgi:hypothetical protein